MTNEFKTVDDHLEPIPDSLKKLAEFLERSLDSGASIVMMRHTPDLCTVYLGDPSGLREELKQVGSIAIPMANDMLALTRSGINRMPLDGQVYRFVRSFTQVGDTAAVVFSAD
ncbi:hypothetical protein [Paraburkholderia sp.]|uniref:hypothetical protein n=1 Tax=Paraburkholderia sp. TaxID=1926495 RepID=UPI002386B24D|nr:hypothetical protein [Paraburkholderia sp.]MDE1179355.1 hypothetical protein [Paraburkholderia sp.]